MAVEEKDKPTVMAETVERRVLTKRNSGNKPVTVTQRTGETDSGPARIHAAAKRDSRLQFTNLYHHLTQERLTRAYKELKRQASSGVDGVTWGAYYENHGERQALHTRLHKGSYRPQASKRIWIEKSDGKTRPIGIAALEDKIVQLALSWIMQSIYEADFMGFSYGFRPQRSQHHALDAIYVAITQKKVNWVLDADIKSYFDSISHAWLMKFLRHRIADRRTLHLVERMLTAGVEEDGKWTKTVVGIPQGSVLSPLLANIYLHYVLDLWVRQWRKRHARGDMIIVRYADDFVMGFQHASDGELLHRQHQRRLDDFGLSLHETKTRLIEFGRFAQSNRQARSEGKPETFNFLGIVHICARTRCNGTYTVHRKTIAQRQRTTLKRIKESLYKRINLHVYEQGQWLSRVVQGFYNYFGVPGNLKSLDAFRTDICRLWLRVLRRRSQKASKYTWENFQRLVRRYIPSKKTMHPYPNQRLRV